MKVLKAMKEHHASMKSLSDFGDSHVQSIITDYIKHKSQMRERKLSDLEASQLLVKPDPFQPEGVLQERTFHFANEMEEYEEFVAYEQDKANRGISRNFYMPQRTPLLHMPNLSKCGWMHCSGCGNMMVHCHDVVFGTFCVYKCIKYCKDTDNTLNDTAIKKVFLDTYNRCLAFVIFRDRTKIVQDKWIFPPLCVQDNSYSYILFWYEWIVEGLWKCKGENDGSEEEEVSAAMMKKCKI